MMNPRLRWAAAMTILLTFFSLPPAHAMLKTMTLKKEPALILAAFGTTTRAAATYDFFQEEVRKRLPDKYKGIRIEWAFTSEIVRERANKKFQKAGSNKRFRSLAQVVADLEDQGYRKLVVQPLHIFPGIEYDSLLKMVRGLEAAFEDFHLMIEVGTPLLLHWEDMERVVEALEGELLPPGNGCNVLVAHGTGETSNPANITYLGLDRMLRLHYPNAVLGSVEGIVTRRDALNGAKACPKKRIRFIPFMFVAGDHIMNDIMGEEPGDDGELSWAMEMKRSGFQIEVPSIKYKGKEYYKGLGFYPELDEIFAESIIRALKKFEQ